MDSIKNIMDYYNPFAPYENHFKCGVAEPLRLDLLPSGGSVCAIEGAGPSNITQVNYNVGGGDREDINAVYGYDDTDNHGLKSKLSTDSSLNLEDAAHNDNVSPSKLSIKDKFNNIINNKLSKTLNKAKSLLNVKINSSNNNNLYISNINSKSLNNISGLNNAVTPSSPVPNLGATANTSLVKYN